MPADDGFWSNNDKCIVTSILYIPAFFLIPIGFLLVAIMLNLTSLTATLWFEIAMLQYKQLPAAAK
jgi:hypothetical protein